MLSRLSGLVNIVLHGLSGDDYYQDSGPPLDPKIGWNPDMEYNHNPQEDVLQCLAYANQLLMELTAVIQQKDVELQQKDEILQEERKASDNKLKKVKLHAKAKVTSLNKHIEELKAQGGVVLPTGPHTQQQHSEHDKHSTEDTNEKEKIKKILQEKEQLISSLQAQLIQAQAEHAAQFDKNSRLMAEFIEMQQHLKEKEDLFGALQAQLDQTQAEQAAQVYTEETVASLQKRVVELENEKGAFHLSPREVEELKVENGMYQ